MNSMYTQGVFVDKRENRRQKDMVRKGGRESKISYESVCV